LPNKTKQNKLVTTTSLKKGIEGVIRVCYYSTEDHLNEEFCNVGYS
jgi:hypothetical protein